MDYFLVAGSYIHYVELYDIPSIWLFIAYKMAIS